MAWKVFAKFRRGLRYGGAKYRWGIKIRDFRPISRYISQRYKRRIGNRNQAFEWYQFQWPWVTPNVDFKVTKLRRMCAQLTRDLFAIAKFLVCFFIISCTFTSSVRRNARPVQCHWVVEKDKNTELWIGYIQRGFKEKSPTGSVGRSPRATAE